MEIHDGARGDARKRHDPHPDPHIAALIRKAQEQAWDEGYKQGGPMHDEHYGDPDAHTRNPYREDES